MNKRYQVTLWNEPIFHTVPACGYKTGGTNTVRLSRETGAAEMRANRAQSVRSNVVIIEEVIIMVEVITLAFVFVCGSGSELVS
jgi:hypothetical protein